MKTFCTLLSTLLLMTISSSAFAKTSDALLEHVPSDSQIVIGMDVPKVKSSFVFNEVLQLLQTQARASASLQFVINSSGFDLEKDVNSMLMAFDRAPTNPQNPVAPQGVTVLHGKFDRERVEKAAADKFGALKARKVGKIEVKEAAGFAIAFLDANTMIIGADDAYTKKAWAANADPKKSAKSNKTIGKLLSLANTKLGIWLAMVTKGMATPGQPAMDGATLSGDLSSGVAVEFRTQFEKAEDAKNALDQFKAMKENQGQDAMIEMVGGKPLMDNLKARVEKEKVLVMSTSMTDDELKVMAVRLKAMTQQAPPVAPSGASGPMSTPTGPAATPTTPTVPGKGADADFN